MRRRSVGPLLPGAKWAEPGYAQAQPNMSKSNG